MTHLANEHNMKKSFENKVKLYIFAMLSYSCKLAIAFASIRKRVAFGLGYGKQDKMFT